MEFISDKIKELIAACGIERVKIQLEYPSSAAHGDYATAAAFEMAKKEKISPRAAAERIAASIKKPDWISKIEAAGSGFVNFTLTPEFLAQNIEEIIKYGGDYGTSAAHKGQTAVTDSSHPNIAKPMGAHHLLSTIIGAALNNMFAATGYKVVRDNYIGDWGTQFGKLIYAYKKWGDRKKIDADPIPELLKLYVKFHEEAEEDPALEAAARAEFKLLEEGDKSVRMLWQWIVNESILEFHKLYSRLGVSFDVIHGESFYENKMAEIIELGIKKKVFMEGDGGALIAPLNDKNSPPCLIRKSDGATLYATRDLARTKYWEDTWHPDLMVIVADSAQILHFKQFFEVAAKLGLTRARNEHIIFGRMRFPESSMSTRKGNIILMEALLDEAEERALAIVKEKNPELSDKQKREVSVTVGIGAVKYAILSQNRLTDVTFTWEKMLSLEGNSGPYLQYAHARAKSILGKADISVIASPAKAGRSNLYSEPQELALARLLPKFPEAVLRAADEFKPNLITNYLFETASAFNTFYAVVPVLNAGPAVRASRLALTEAASIVLKNGLALLGIEAPEEM